MSFARFWWPAKKHDILKPGLKLKSLNLYAEEYLTMDTINGYVSLSMQPLQATQRQPRAATTGPFRHDKLVRWASLIISGECAPCDIRYPTIRKCPNRRN